jgi:hypothetical protein
VFSGAAVLDPLRLAVFEVGPLELVAVAVFPLDGLLVAVGVFPLAALLVALAPVPPVALLVGVAVLDPPVAVWEPEAAEGVLVEELDTDGLFAWVLPVAELEFMPDLPLTSPNNAFEELEAAVSAELRPDTLPFF